LELSTVATGILNMDLFLNTLALLMETPVEQTAEHTA
jgi:hypothetical protein